MEDAVATVWQFLSSAENRETLAWIGGGLAVLASGLWVVIKHYTTRPVPKPAAETRPGLAGGREIRIGDVALSRLALVLAALSVVLLGIGAVLGRGDTITGSVTADRDIRDSTITIGAPPPQPAD
jgi:hypothetical protein